MISRKFKITEIKEVDDGIVVILEAQEEKVVKAEIPKPEIPKQERVVKTSFYEQYESTDPMERLTKLLEDSIKAYEEYTKRMTTPLRYPKVKDSIYLTITPEEYEKSGWKVGDIIVIEFYLEGEK